MQPEDHNLIAQLRDRASDPFRAVDIPQLPYCSPREKYPPLSAQQIVIAETRLGFHLPPLLRTIYLYVSNGGVGPGHGLVGLDGGPTICDGDLVGHYLELVHNGPPPPYHPWPPQFITICDWGCNMSSELDWTNLKAPVFFFDGNYYEPEQPWETAMRPEAPSLYTWFETWLNK
jgi:hypothetical protein